VTGLVWGQVPEPAWELVLVRGQVPEPVRELVPEQAREQHNWPPSSLLTALR